MNVDNEPLFVVNKKTLTGAVGPKIGMHVARISAALSFYWTGTQMLKSCSWGAASARPASPTEEEERKECTMAKNCLGDAGKKEKRNYKERETRHVFEKIPRYVKVLYFNKSFIIDPHKFVPQ